MDLVPKSQTKTDQHSESTTVLDRAVTRPKMYKVLLHNDDYTTMEFVVFVLQKVFFKSSEEANQLMLKIHQNGQAVCGVYTFEIAETKAAKVSQLAKQNEHPLKCSIEAE